MTYEIFEINLEKITILTRNYISILATLYSKIQFQLIAEAKRACLYRLDFFPNCAVSNFWSLHNAPLSSRLPSNEIAWHHQGHSCTPIYFKWKGKNLLDSFKTSILLRTGFE